MKHPRAPGKHHLSPRSESWTLKEWGDDFWPPTGMEEEHRTETTQLKDDGGTGCP